MSKTPFKMRSGNTTPFKQMGSSSPAKLVDVIVDDEVIGTGAEAQAEGLKQEKVNVKALQEALTYHSPDIKGDVTQEKIEQAAIDEEQRKIQERKKIKTVTYTDQDALDMINKQLIGKERDEALKIYRETGEYKGRGMKQDIITGA